MGNKYAFSYYECDSCNEHFGRMEYSLSNLAGVLNSFSLVKGKKGYAIKEIRKTSKFLGLTKIA